MPQPSKYVLVLAKSARMLAQASFNTGFNTLTIDLFGDQDTLNCTTDYRQIPDFSLDNLNTAVDYFIANYPISYAIYGSGFDQHIGSLKWLDARILIAGNHPHVLTRLQDKPGFFSILELLDIPYPKVLYSKPIQPEGWLVKPCQGEGGVGISRYRADERLEQAIYWQEYIEGIPHSVLFLADGKRSQIIGFNRQWTTALTERDEFIFSGIINTTDLSPDTKNIITNWTELLTSELGLKGLNSMDFIQNGQTSFVLEINPRPPASMQLYNADLFSRHLHACQGELLALPPQKPECTAYQIIFANQDTLIPTHFKWPKDVVDIPVANSTISTGQPIYSMIIRGDKPQNVLAQLANQKEFITNQLLKFSNSWNTPPA